MLHQPVEIIARIGNTDDSDRRPVPQPAGIEFGNRHIKVRPQAVFQAAHYLALVLQRLGSLDAEFESEEGKGTTFRVRIPDQPGGG